MREPISVYLNPPAFGRSRTKAGGFVRFGGPSGELSGDSFAEGAKPLTDSGDLAGGGSGMRVNWGLSVGIRISNWDLSVSLYMFSAMLFRDVGLP